MDTKNQISKVTSCHLKRIGSLTFNHALGDCVNVADDRIYLCFNNEYGEYSRCHVGASPTGKFNRTRSSQYDHQYSRIATNDDVIMAMGSYQEHTKAELFTVDENTWTEIDRFPFCSGYYLTYAPIIFLFNSFYVVGGMTKTGYESTIGRFNIATNKWTRVGDLVNGRWAHNVIYDGQYLLVIGGGIDYGHPPSTPRMTEKCSISETSVDCISQEPKLHDYWYYPELVIVPNEFCKMTP